MDSEAVRRKRMEDIEAKRKRLEEMRKSRANISTTTTATAKPPSSATDEKHNEADPVDTDALISSLLGSKPLETDNSKEDPSEPPTPKQSSKEVLQEKINSFSTVKLSTVIHILPTASVTYDKECQTEAEDQTFLDMEDEETTLSERNSQGYSSPQTLSLLRSNSIEKATPTLQTTIIPVEEQPPSPQKLTEEEVNSVVSSESFLRFLGRSSRFVERALELQEDILRDYREDVTQALNVRENQTFEQRVGGSYEEEVLVGRPLMDLKWSPHLPGLFLAAYGAKKTSVSPSRQPFVSSPSGNSTEDSPGLLCVWSKEMHKRPEFLFTASSPVLTALFHPQQQHLVLGACYSGQILLWDLRGSSSLPVQRSSMSGKGHKHPVYSMAMVTSSLTMELVSVSTDGMLCHWDVTRLIEPITVVSLNSPSRSLGEESLNTGPLNVTCMETYRSDAGLNLVLGSGAGQLFRCALPFRPSDPAHANSVEQIEAHFGSITSITVHPSNSKKYKTLLLSASLDWTVKLWNLDNKSLKSLCEFVSPMSFDYVVDVGFSPAHPALFCALTAGGRLSMWDLSKSTAEPVDYINIRDKVTEEDNNKNSEEVETMNKMLWSPDGQGLLIGDAAGLVHTIDIVAAGALMPSNTELSRIDVALFENLKELSLELGVGLEESKSEVVEGFDDLDELLNL